jgi:hypothetical protein
MSNETANEQALTEAHAVIRALQYECREHKNAAARAKLAYTLELTTLKEELDAQRRKANNCADVIKYIKDEVIPANYPYRSNCSSPFCKFITALRMHGLD